MPLTSFLVTDAVQRRKHALRELCSLGEDRFDQVGRGVGKAGQVVVAIDVEHIAQQKHHVINGSFVGRHDVSLPLPRPPVAG